MGKYRSKKTSTSKKTNVPNDQLSKLAISRQKQFKASFDRQQENDGHFSETINCLYVRPDPSPPVQPQTPEVNAITDSTIAPTQTEKSKSEVEKPKRNNHRRGRHNRQQHSDRERKTDKSDEKSTRGVGTKLRGNRGSNRGSNRGRRGKPRGDHCARGNEARNNQSKE